MSSLSGYANIVGMTHVVALAVYTTLSYLYFVERAYLWAAVVWLVFLSIKSMVPATRKQASLLFVVGSCMGIMNLLSQFTPWLQWPVDFYIAALMGFLLSRFVLKQPTEKLNWSFSFSKLQLLSVLLINVPSVAILYLYYKSHPEVAEMFPSLDVPFWSLPLIIIAVAAINGLREEIFYRGLIQPLSSQESPPWFVISLQAVLFGFLHFSNAFPQGWTGVFLTGLWGMAIAIQYWIFRSITLAWLTHAVADAMMFSIIIASR